MSYELHELARSGNVNDIRNAVVTLGMDVNSRDSEGYTPLHYAAMKGHLDAIEVLVRLTAYVNAQNDDGETPLHVAARREQFDSIKSLLDNGADVRMKNDREITVVDIAKRSNLYKKNEEYRQYILKLERENFSSGNDEMDFLKKSLEMEKSKCSEKLKRIEAKLEECMSSSNFETFKSLTKDLATMTDENGVLDRALHDCNTRQSKTGNEPERLKREVVHPNILNKIVTDVITLEEIHVLEFLSSNPTGIVLFDQDVPYLVYTPEIIKTFDRSAAFPCRKVGSLAQVDTTTELYMGTMLGIQGVYIIASDLRDALSMAFRGKRVFRLTNTLYEVPAIAGKLVVEGRSDYVSSNHCQEGGDGPVKGLKYLELFIGIENPTLSDNVKFLEDAKIIASNSTVPSQTNMVMKTLEASSKIIIPADRYSQLSWTIAWRQTSHLAKKDKTGDYLINTLDPNLVTLINSLRPKIPSVSIIHGSPFVSFTDASFLRSIVGLTKFYLRQNGPKNGFSIRSVVSALESHADTLVELYLDCVDSEIPPLNKFKKLETLTLVFDDYDNYRAPLYSLLEPLMTISTLKKLVLKDSVHTTPYSGKNLENALYNLRVGTLELHLKKFRGSLDFTTAISNNVVIKG